MQRFETGLDRMHAMYNPQEAMPTPAKKSSRSWILGAVVAGIGIGALAYILYTSQKASAGGSGGLGGQGGTGHSTLLGDAYFTNLTITSDCGVKTASGGGVLKDAFSDTPIGGARVEIIDANSGNVLFAVTTASNGSFTFNNVNATGHTQIATRFGLGSSTYNVLVSQPFQGCSLAPISSPIPAGAYMPPGISSNGLPFLPSPISPYRNVRTWWISNPEGNPRTGRFFIPNGCWVWTGQGKPTNPPPTPWWICQESMKNIM